MSLVSLELGCAKWALQHTSEVLSCAKRSLAVPIVSKSIAAPSLADNLRWMQIDLQDGHYGDDDKSCVRTPILGNYKETVAQKMTSFRF